MSKVGVLWRHAVRPAEPSLQLALRLAEGATRLLNQRKGRPGQGPTWLQPRWHRTDLASAVCGCKCAVTVRWPSVVGAAADATPSCSGSNLQRLLLSPSLCSASRNPRHACTCTPQTHPTTRTQHTFPSCCPLHPCAGAGDASTARCLFDAPASPHPLLRKGGQPDPGSIVERSRRSSTRVQPPQPSRRVSSPGAATAGHGLRAKDRRSRSSSPVRQESAGGVKATPATEAYGPISDVMSLEPWLAEGVVEEWAGAGGSRALARGMGSSKRRSSGAGMQGPPFANAHTPRRSPSGARRSESGRGREGSHSGVWGAGEGSHSPGAAPGRTCGGDGGAAGGMEGEEAPQHGGDRQGGAGFSVILKKQASQKSARCVAAVRTGLRPGSSSGSSRLAAQECPGVPLLAEWCACVTCQRAGVCSCVRACCFCLHMRAFLPHRAPCCAGLSTGRCRLRPSWPHYHPQAGSCCPACAAALAATPAGRNVCA